MIEKNDPRLTAFVLGELAGDELANIQSAIDASPQLQEAVEEIESATLAVSAAFENEPSLDSVMNQNTVSPFDVSSIGSLPAVSSYNRRLVHWAAACSIAILAGLLALTILDANKQDSRIDLAGGIQVENIEGFVGNSLASVGDIPAENDDDPFGSNQGETKDTDFEPLIDMIKNSVEPDSWEDTNDSDLEMFEPNLSMIVSQGQDLNGDTDGQWEDPGLASIDTWPSSRESEAREALDLLGIPGYLAVEQTVLGHGYGPAEVDRDEIDRFLALNENSGSDGRGELAYESGMLAGNLQVPMNQDESTVRKRAVRAANRNFGGGAGRGDSSGDLEQSLTQRRQKQVEFLSRLFESEGTHVDTFTFDDSTTTQRATDKEPLDVLLGATAKPTGTKEVDTSNISSEGELRAGFQIDEQIMQAEVSLQVALQRFGPTHPVVKTLRAQVRMLNSFRENALTGASEFDADETSKAIASALLARINKQIRALEDEHNRKIRQRRGWRRVNATSNTSRLIVGDKDELDMTGIQVHVQVDGFRARVLMDCFYYNDRDRQLEGNFKIRLPDDASLYYFAFGQSAYDFSPDGPMAKNEFVDGNDHYVSLQAASIGLARQDAWQNVKEARMVPREKAAFAYSQTVRRRVDPALAEWSGAGIFNARVFPLMPHKLHRIVIGYDVNLTATDNGSVYRLDLPAQSGECRVDLSVSDFENGHWRLELGGDDTTDENDSSVSEWESKKAVGNGRSHKRIQFDQPEWKSLTLVARNTKPVVLKSMKSEKGDFFATRIRADLPVAKQKTNNQAVFLLDTSLSSRPDKFNVWLDLLRATMENNRDDLTEFAVLFFDVDHRFWQTQYSANTPENVDNLMKDCFQIGLEGATNLHGAMQELADADWLTSDGKRPDIFLLSDGATNWGETNLHLIQQEFENANVGSLFAYQTGLPGTAISSLRFLAGSTGGAVFSVAPEDEIVRASTAHRNKPWRLNSIEFADSSDLMTAGRIEWVYPGQWITVVGRGDPTGDLTLDLHQGNVRKTVTVSTSTEIESELASRLFGHVAVGQLETLGNKVFDVSAAYARHFRITGETCSLLMLESEADYRRFDIKPKEDWFVIQSKNASDVVESALDKDQALLSDPKAQLMNWIGRLETMPGLEFTMPTALKIAIEDMTIEAIDGRLDCQSSEKDEWSKKYSESLAGENLDAAVIAIEAKRRRAISVDDALKATSSLVESNPGDWVIARDVAFTAMELGRPAAAYHLLRRVIHRRPYEGSTYAAIGQCLGQLGKADMAMVFYELALGSKFQNQGTDFRKIVATDYASLLRRITRNEISSSAQTYARARAESLQKFSVAQNSDLVISMMWNTDQTDVDLHVIEPSGEECCYNHRETKSGGRITTDITTGFGPEMYVLESAPSGEFEIKIKYFGSNQSRTAVTNKVYLTIYENYGSENETATHETITLQTVGQKELVKKFKLKE